MKSRSLGHLIKFNVFKIKNQSMEVQISNSTCIMFTEEELVKSQIQIYFIDGANILKQR